MKFMSYNILDGAPNTLHEIIAIVSQENPEYLTINEANTFLENNENILKMFAHKTGFTYFQIAKSGRENYHVAIFSKIPFLKVEKLPNFARACIITLINTPFGQLSVASTHLSPYSEDERLSEIQQIIDYQKPYKYKIIMGDLNSLARNDDYENDIVKTFNEKQLRKFTKNGRLRFDVTDTLLSNDYVDAAFEKGQNKINTVPTQVNEDLAHFDARLDYFFLSTSLLTNLKSYTVIKNKLSDRASDHYPIVIELET